MNKTHNPIIVEPAAVWWRLFAWIYDALVVVSLLMIVVPVSLLIVNLVAPGILDREPDLLRKSLIWPVYLYLATTPYFIWCWRKSGQSLGGMAWRLKVVTEDGSSLSALQAFKRAVLALGGLGILWGFVDKNKRGWHDVACDTLVVRMPKPDRSAHKKLREK